MKYIDIPFDETLTEEEIQSLPAWARTFYEERQLILRLTRSKFTIRIIL